MLIATLFCAISSFAQQPGDTARSASGSIIGKVTSSTGQKGTDILSGITVKLTSTAPGSLHRTTLTDFEGHFEFTHLPQGSYNLEAVLEGFQSWTSTVSLGLGEILTKDIPLQINSVEERIEVQGETTEIATESVSATATVTEQQLEELPLRTQKFTEALSISPSVIRTQEGKLNFNGQSESQGMLLVDSAENVDPVSGSFAIPIPVNTIQNIQVFTTPDSSAYGGFSGGLTRIDIRPPAPAWNYKLLDIVPSFRGKNDHLIGLLNMTPGVEIGGPLIKNKLNFSETMTYEFRKDPVHGLTWPWNETVTYSLVSFTEFQYTFSNKHVVNFNFNVFPSTVLYANINALIPQTASANIRRRGSSVGISDAYQLDSGAVLTTLVRYTNFYNSEHGQGLADMTINPEGWGGNYFNTFSRNGNQMEALPILQLTTLSWLGSHQVQLGTDVLYRTFTGSSVSRPINLLAQDGTIDETINFLGAGRLQSSDEEISGYAEDRWSLAKHMAFTMGGRVTHQTFGRNAAFAPRLGLSYSTPNGKIAVRAGAGLIYGHVPLLAADFAGYQERMITLNPGTLAAQSYILQNVYQSPGMAGNSSTLTNSDASTHTFTWNVEAETSPRRDLSLRLGYYETRTTNLFVLNPIVPAGGGTSGFMALDNSGRSNYQQAQMTARYRPSERNEINISYAWSRARGDLNTVSDTFLPVQVPVIRPNLFGVRPSDIPNRVLAWGYITLPKKFVFSPVADVHSGFPYSNVDNFQNYASVPNSLRFPIYFSLDVKLSREFTVRMPFKENAKRKKINIGVFSQDVTNRLNPHDVYNNVTAPFPLFGQFAGFQRRLTGLDINLTE
ncbi:MAG TPA: TonB-dependent receptor [Candidatus Acidoferrales bacterium]|nr:TonB-dependent receptor [Candidatus Acidoferrales bacterium]